LFFCGRFLSIVNIFPPGNSFAKCMPTFDKRAIGWTVDRNALYPVTHGTHG
jgi:hypothetical protein